MKDKVNVDADKQANEDKKKKEVEKNIEKEVGNLAKEDNKKTVETVE